MPKMFLRTICAMQTWLSYAERPKSYLHSVLQIEIENKVNNKNKKTRRKKKTVLSSFTHKRKVVLKSQPKGDPQFSLKKYYQKQIAIMSWCIKDQQIKKHSLALRKIKRSIENNLKRNAKTPSLRFFCKKGVLKKFIRFTGKHLYQSLSSDKVACHKPAIY